MKNSIGKTMFLEKREMYPAICLCLCLFVLLSLVTVVICCCYPPVV